MSSSALTHLRQHWIHYLAIILVAVAVALSFFGSSASDSQGSLRSSRKLIRPIQVAPQGQQQAQGQTNGYAATNDYAATDDFGPGAGANYSATDDLRGRMTRPGENEIAIPGF